MNIMIMLNKMVNFIAQLCHTTQWRLTQTLTSEVSKYQLLSQPKLDQFQLLCYSECSVTATCFHAAMQTFAPLIMHRH